MYCQVLNTLIMTILYCAKHDYWFLITWHICRTV